MSKTLEDLQREMEIAASDLDFEKARQIRDRIGLLRGGAEATDAEAADTSGLARQQPGTMGLGTSRQRPVLPPDWKPPKKPDLMTSGQKRKGRTRLQGLQSWQCWEKERRTRRYALARSHEGSLHTARTAGARQCRASMKQSITLPLVDT